MSRHGQRPAPLPQPARALAPVEPLPVVDTLPVAPLPPPAPVAPPAPAPRRLVALSPIHAGRIYAPGDEIPASIAAQLTQGEHWREV